MNKNQAVILFLAASLTSVAGAPSVEPPAGFRLLIDRAGVFRVSHGRLVEAGLVGEPRTARIALLDAAKPRPLWIDDGGDGRFGRGDALYFLAQPVQRAAAYRGGAPSLRAYTLRLDADATHPGRVFATGSADAAGPGPLFEGTLELERDLRREAVIGSGGPAADTWYWAELTHADRGLFELPVKLEGLDRGSDRPIVVRAHVLGRSRLNAEQRRGGAEDHRLVVRWNDRVVGSFDWDGSGNRHTVEAVVGSDIPAGPATLSLQVPPRTLSADPADPAPVDVVLLDRIDVRYPRGAGVDGPETRMTVAASRTGRCVALRPAKNGSLTLWRADGLRLDPTPADASGRRQLCSDVGWPEGLELFATLGPPSLEPLAVERVRPPRLRRADNRADYVMITHPDLREALEPLAALHRARGLAVEVVSIEDVYDEFHDGVPHPIAIRRFLEFVLREWRPPVPRFVLLAGDASWDRREPGHRDLIPTMTAAGSYGHAATDNPLACVADDDDRPDLALGRLPAATPAELRAMVAKTIRHVSHGSVGPWKRRILWITDDAAASQYRSDFMARSLAADGFLSTRVYASGDAPAADRQALFDAFDRGHMLVHFYGHGGRLVWRTGPPDPGRNRELFAIQHVNDLAPADGLPVVLALSCYSAPFDHPTEDSIGERFVRLPDRGAIAVIAAGWRNAPTPLTTRLLVEQLTRPGTVGEALMRAKRAGSGSAFRAQYNLLGDPAVPLAVPLFDVRVEVVATAGAVAAVGDAPRIRARVERADFTGRAIVDWVDAWGAPLHTAEYAVARGIVEAELQGVDARGVAGAVVYVWDREAAIDGMGGVVFAATENVKETP